MKINSFSSFLSCCCNNSEDIVGTTDYFGNFISCISHKNIYGVQFHPKKVINMVCNYLKIVKFNVI